MIDDNNTLPARVSPIAQLAPIPEEEIWLQKAEERAAASTIRRRLAAFSSLYILRDGSRETVIPEVQ